MRTFTLVIGTFNLEVEETEERKGGFKVYSAKCEKVGFSVQKHSSIDSISFPFNEYLGKKNLRYQRVDYSKVIYKGFTLELEYTIHTYLGICKEIEFEDDHYIDDLITAFLNKVDKYLENTMKTQFTVVYEGFTLEVSKRKVDNKLLYGGECKTLAGFYRENRYQNLNNLVELFQEAVDEYLKPTEIEYIGHKLEIFPSKETKNKFEGYSDICGGWETVQDSKEEVVETFKKRVDTIIRLHVKNLESAVAEKQEKLEEYLRSQRYKFDTVVTLEPVRTVVLYAVHPTYWSEWCTDEGEINDKVVFIRQQ